MSITSMETIRQELCLMLQVLIGNIGEGSPMSVEKHKIDLQTLNAQVASAISNPNVAYMVFPVNGKT